MSVEYFFMLVRSTRNLLYEASDYKGNAAKSFAIRRKKEKETIPLQSVIIINID